jgi:hypothetical protein
MPTTAAIDGVSDASVALKWFDSEGEEEVEPPVPCSWASVSEPSH